jgi:UDP-N-acetylmuramyl tripeptide synthase
MRRPLAILVAHLAAAASRLVGAGGGTTIPGRLAMAVAPGIVTDLAARFPHGVVLVSGTNGKTTTSRLLGGILDAAGFDVVHNRAGANLLTGIASAMLARTSVSGAIRPLRRAGGGGGEARGAIGLFEVDEFTLPAAVEATRPAALVLLNLFRDQLDRFGEIDLIADRWRRALAAMSPSTVVTYNGDDPLVADVCRAFTGRAVVFGLDDAPARLHDAQTLEHAADARYCYACGRPYAYSLVTLGHMGHYRCPQCGTTRPAPDVRASRIVLQGADGATFMLTADGHQTEIRSTLPGLYNVYDVTGAAAAALALGIDAGAIERGIAATAPAFGRGERVIVDGAEVVLLLAKNPAGFNEVLRTVLLADGDPVVLIAINDLTADGRDISWLWDVDFEMLRDRAQAVVASGERAEDMALRLKYAGLSMERVTVERDLGRALMRARAYVPGGRPHIAGGRPHTAGGRPHTAGGRLFVLPTYTAMLHLREVMARKGYVQGFWKQ